MGRSHHRRCSRSSGVKYPSEAYVILRGKQNKAMADQLATVSIARLGSKIGRVSVADLQEVERAIRVQLGLGP